MTKMKNLIILLAVVLVIYAPQISYSQSGLSPEDIEYIKEMKEKHLWPDTVKEEDVTPEKLIEIKKIIKKMEAYIKAKQEIETRKPLTDNELAQLDTLLRSKWDAMRDALSKSEIDRAVSYFSDSTKNSYRKIFSALCPKECKQLAQDLGNIQFIKEMGYSAEYDLRRSENGKEYSYQLIFEKTMDGEWNIRSF
jgi:hypothetical protein